MHSQTLNQILDGFKLIGVHVQKTNREALSPQSVYPSPSISVSPAVPTQPEPNPGLERDSESKLV
jgi:hypothetical protein